MKKRYFAYAILPVVAFGVIGTGVAFAHGMGGFGGWGMMRGAISVDNLKSAYDNMFQIQSDILGISVDEYKNLWASGKSFQQIAKDKGISQDTIQSKMKDLRIQQMKDELQSLVSAGVLTQAQADQRLQFMQSNSNGNGMGKKFGRGFFR